MSQTESDTIAQETSTSKRSGLPWYVWVCVSLPFVYVLSIGPVAKLYDLGYIRGARYAAVERIYAPLDWAANNCTPFAHFLIWYLRVWGVRSPGRK
jgi:hypothetical protein